MDLCSLTREHARSQWDFKFGERNFLPFFLVLARLGTLIFLCLGEFISNQWWGSNIDNNCIIATRVPSHCILLLILNLSCNVWNALGHTTNSLTRQNTRRYNKFIITKQEPQRLLYE